MTEEKNVLLTVVHKDNADERDGLVVDFGAIWKHVKRLFAVWLCLAVGIGSLSGALALLLQNRFEPKETKALITLSDNQAYDINKIKSPAVIEDALNEMGLDAEATEEFQNALTVQSIIPNDAYERMSMYYDMLSKNSTAVAIVDALLDTQYQSSQYVISFEYASADLNADDGVEFLNHLLRAYQEYCAFNYNYNTPLSNPLTMIDYHDYDYAEAVNIFATTLDNIAAYLASFNSAESASFRSVETGFTFEDLKRSLSVLRDVNLDRVSSYIVIHSISTYDAETEISYYEWMIENLTQQRAIQRTRLNSLTDSIDAYEKDSLIVISSPDGGSVVSGSQNLNSNYDAMIEQKLSTQAAIASYTRSISFYERVIEGFRQSGASSNSEDIEKVNEYLKILNDGVSQLVRNVSLTANEYYEKVAFSTEVCVLVPAVVEKNPLISAFAVKMLLVVEFPLFALYLCWAFALGLREANPSEKESAEENPSFRKDGNGAESVPL